MTTKPIYRHCRACPGNPCADVSTRFETTGMTDAPHMDPRHKGEDDAGGVSVRNNNCRLIRGHPCCRD